MIIPGDLEGKTAFVSLLIPKENFIFYSFLIPNLEDKYIIEGKRYAIAHLFVNIKYGTQDGIWIINNSQKETFGQILTQVPDRFLLGVHILEGTVAEKDMAQVGFVPPGELEKVQYLAEDLK